MIEPSIHQPTRDSVLDGNGAAVTGSFYQRIVNAYNNFRRDLAIKKVEKNGLELRKVSVRFQDDERVVLAAVKDHGCALQVASERLKGNKAIVLEAIAKGGYAFDGYLFRYPFECVSDVLKDDPEVVEAAFQKDRSSLKFASKNRVLDKVRQDGRNLQYASEDHCNDPEVVEAAFQNDPAALRFASRSCVLAKVQQDGLAIRHASEELQDDSEVVEAAFQNNPSTLKRASKARVLEIVGQNGLALEHVSFNHLYDSEVCEAAFQNNPYALQFAYSGFVLTTVQQHGLALQYASESDRNYSAIIFQAAFQNDPFALQFTSSRYVRLILREDGLALQYASQDHRNDHDHVHAAVSQNGLALQYASQDHRNDHDLVRAAVSQNGLALQYASDALRGNREIVRAAIRQNIAALQYASQALQNDPTIHQPFNFLGINEESYFTVRLEDIDDNPVQVLRDLYPKMKNGFPKIGYDGSPGLDAGGLSRDFVTRMMKAVCDLDKKPLPMTENGGKIIPLIEDGKPDQIAGYQAIGAIFAYALEKRQEIVTGNYFHPMFFQMIHSLTGAEIAALPDLSNYGDIPEEIVNKLFRIYAREELHFSDEQINGILQGNISQELQGYGFNAKDDFFNSNFKQMALACTVISKSMRAHLSNPSNWDNIKGVAVEFATKIEGSLTREGVLGALEWTKDHETTKGYLVKWVDECSLEELEKFVWAVTGSRTLAPGQKLKIELYSHVEKLPTYHTCFFKMDLPDGYPTYEVFKQKLEQSLTSVNGMQMA